jgi:hypothetical protein
VLKRKEKEENYNNEKKKKNPIDHWNDLRLIKDRSSELHCGIEKRHAE